MYPMISRLLSSYASWSWLDILELRVEVLDITRRLELAEKAVEMEHQRSEQLGFILEHERKQHELDT